MTTWRPMQAPCPEGRHLLEYREAALVTGRHGGGARLCLVFGVADEQPDEYMREYRIRIFCDLAISAGAYLGKLIAQFRGRPLVPSELGRIEDARPGAPVPEHVLALLRPLRAWAWISHIDTAAGHKRAVIMFRKQITPDPLREPVGVSLTR